MRGAVQLWQELTLVFCCCLSCSSDAPPGGEHGLAGSRKRWVPGDARSVHTTVLEGLVTPHPHAQGGRSCNATTA